MTQLTSLRLAGWKSIRDATIELRPLNVLIGANGAGKSNLVSFFKLMNEMMGSRFQVHIATIGGAESLLHYGSKRTSVLEADFRFTSQQGQNGYFIRLLPVAGNSFVFAQEYVAAFRDGAEDRQIYVSDPGHGETLLNQAADAG